MADDGSSAGPAGPWGRAPTQGDFLSAGLDKARAFLQARNPDAAIREAETVFAQDPNGSYGYDALDLIADAQTEKGDFETVAKIGRELLSIDPDRLEGYLHLARGALERDDMRTCIQAIERGLAHYPQSVSLILLNSIRFRQAHDYGRAVAWAEQAVELAPWHPGALTTLGYALKAADREEDARKAFAEARELDPTAAFSFHTAALVAFEENRFADAQVEALKALELDPQDADARRVLFRARIFGNPLMWPFWKLYKLNLKTAGILAGVLFGMMIGLGPAGRLVFPIFALYFFVCFFVVLVVQAIDDHKKPPKPPTLKNY